MTNQKMQHSKVVAQPKLTVNQTRPVVAQPKVKGALPHVRKQNPVTADAVRRVQRAIAAQNEGKTPKGSLAARLQSVFARMQGQ